MYRHQWGVLRLLRGVSRRVERTPCSAPRLPSAPLGVQAQFSSTLNSPFKRAFSMDAAPAVPPSEVEPKAPSDRTPSRLVMNKIQSHSRAELLHRLDRVLHQMNVNIQRTGRVLPNDLEEAMTQMKDLGSCTANQALTLLRSCGHVLSDEKPSTRIQLSLEVWQLLEKLKVPLDNSHFNALLKCHLENGHRLDPQEFVTWMESHGAEPNRVTYQQLISCFCEVGEVNQALGILELMKDKSMPINEQVFLALIKGHCHSQDLESAQSTVTIMQQSGLDMGSQGHLAFILGMIEAGQPWEVVKARLDQNMSQDEVAFDDQDMFQIILALSKRSEEQAAREMVNMLPRKSGFFQEVRNIVPQLVYQNQVELALEILTSVRFPPKSNPAQNDAENKDHATFFLRALVRHELPIDQVREFLKRIMRDINDQSCARFLEACIDCDKTAYGKEAMKMIVKEFGSEAVNAEYFTMFCRRRVGNSRNKNDVLKFLSKFNHVGLRLNMSTVSNDLMKKILTGNQVGTSLAELHGQVQQNYGFIFLSNCAVQYLLNQENEDDFERAAGFCLHRAPPNINPILWNSSLARSYLTTLNLDHFMAILINSATDNLVQRERHSKNNPEQNLIVLFKTLVHIHSLAPRYQPDTSPDEVLTPILSALKTANLGIPHAVGEQLRNCVSDETIATEIKELVGIFEEKNGWTADSRQALLRGIKSKYQVDQSRERVRVSVLPNTLATLEQQMDQFRNSEQSTNAILCSKFANAAISEGQVEKALDLFKEFQDKFLANIGIARDFIAKCIELDRMDIAAEFVDLQFEHGGKILNTSFKAFLESLIAKGDHEAALSTVKKINGTNLTLETIAVTLIPCVKAYDGTTQKKEISEFIAAAEATGLVSDHGLKEIKIEALIHTGELEEAVQIFESTAREERKFLRRRSLSQKLISIEDVDMMQRVLDASISLVGEESSIYDLSLDFLVMGKFSQARKVLDTPGLRYNHNRIKDICENFLNMGNLEALEKFVVYTRSIFACDRNYLYGKLLEGSSKNPDKINDIWLMMQEEGHVPTNKLKVQIARMLEKHGRQPPFEVAERIQKPQTMKTLSEVNSSSSSSSSSDEDETPEGEAKVPNADK